MSDTIIPRRPIVPVVAPNKNGHANNGPQGTTRPKPVAPVSIQTTTTTLRTTTSTSNPNNVILAAHPQDNEIAGSVNHRLVNLSIAKSFRFKLIESYLISRSDQSPNVNIPYPVENDGHRETHGAKLNLGAIIALGAFGGFVFLAAVITTIVVLVRR